MSNHAALSAVVRIEAHSDSRPEVKGDFLFFDTQYEVRNAQRILKDFGQEAWVTQDGLGLYVG